MQNALALVCNERKGSTQNIIALLTVIRVAV